jgi:anti-sigma factor RsiW
MAPQDTTSPRDLTCREVTEFLGEYLAAELGDAARRSFEVHLAECPDCVAYLRQYQTTIGAARDVCEGDARAAGVPEELVEAILAARRAPPSAPPERRRD